MKTILFILLVGIFYAPMHIYGTWQKDNLDPYVVETCDQKIMYRCDGGSIVCQELEDEAQHEGCKYMGMYQVHRPLIGKHYFTYKRGFRMESK